MTSLFTNQKSIKSGSIFKIHVEKYLAGIIHLAFKNISTSSQKITTKILMKITRHDS